MGFTWGSQAIAVLRQHPPKHIAHHPGFLDKTLVNLLSCLTIWIFKFQLSNLEWNGDFLPLDWIWPPSGAVIDHCVLEVLLKGWELLANTWLLQHYAVLTLQSLNTPTQVYLPSISLALGSPSSLNMGSCFFFHRLFKETAITTFAASTPKLVSLWVRDVFGISESNLMALNIISLCYSLSFLCWLSIPAQWNQYHSLGFKTLVFCIQFSPTLMVLTCSSSCLGFELVHGSSIPCMNIFLGISGKPPHVADFKFYSH